MQVFSSLFSSFFFFSELGSEPKALHIQTSAPGLRGPVFSSLFWSIVLLTYPTDLDLSTLLLQPLRQVGFQTRSILAPSLLYTSWSFILNIKKNSTFGDNEEERHIFIANTLTFTIIFCFYKKVMSCGRKFSYFYKDLMIGPSVVIIIVCLFVSAQSIQWQRIVYKSSVYF